MRSILLVERKGGAFAVRRIIERLVTRQDYFHIPHVAEDNPFEPLRSYYYDLRERVDYPGDIVEGIPIVSVGHHTYPSPIAAAQLGLSNLQHYWDTEDESYLRDAEFIARALVQLGRRTERGLLWSIPVDGYCHCLSSMIQGQAASFLLRVGGLLGDDYLFDSGKLALLPLEFDIGEGGVRTTLNGRLWFEEYAIDPPRYTLNGFIVTLFGIRDAAILLKAQNYYDLWNEGIESLTINLQFFDSSGWSLYDLSVINLRYFSLKNFASPFYQRFHIELLRVLEKLTAGNVFAEYRDRWTTGLAAGSAFYRGVFGKVIYRLLEPKRHLETGTTDSEIH